MRAQLTRVHPRSVPGHCPWTPVAPWSTSAALNTRVISLRIGSALDLLEGPTLEMAGGTLTLLLWCKCRTVRLLKDSVSGVEGVGRGR